jgi:hypothetical protein
MSNNWLHNIKHVAPGEPVQAGIVNRPDRALEDRTDYLRERLDASELGRAVFDNDASVSPDVKPGQAVFWNAAESRYEQALAAVEVDQETQTFVVRPSTDCVGICWRKKSETLGDICLRGIIDLETISNAVVGAVTPGRYYLSASTPGKITKQRPAVTVSVCHIQTVPDDCKTTTRVVVMPNSRELLDEHTHYRFDLYARPAGTNTLVGDVRSIVNPDIDEPGWLPATDEVFEGKAPGGAVFGYNIKKHPSLLNVWPPLPLQSVAMLWDKGTDLVGATEIPLGRNGLAICDVNGIWWMSNCDGDQPWPSSYTTVPVEDPTPPVSECPRDEVMRISVVYIRMLVSNDRRVVTSLQPAEGSPIVVSCAGLPATTGDLKLGLNLQYATPQGNGALVVKEVAGQKLRQGFVTEGLVAHNLAQISITGTADRLITNAEKEDLGFTDTDGVVIPGNVTLHRGLLRFDFDDQFAERELLPQIVRLNDTVERLYLDIPYLGFPENQASSMRLRFNVPYGNIGDGLQMRVRVQYFGKGTSSIPALTMSRRLIKRPGITAGTAIGLPTTDDGVDFNSVATLPANTAIERDSAPFGVDAGDTVLITLARPATTGYPEIGILRVTGIISRTT